VVRARLSARVGRVEGRGEKWGVGLFEYGFGFELEF